MGELKVCSTTSDSQSADSVHETYLDIQDRYPGNYLMHPFRIGGMTDAQYEAGTVNWTYGVCTEESAGGVYQHGYYVAGLLRENGGEFIRAGEKIKCLECHGIIAYHPNDVYYPRVPAATAAVPACNSCHALHDLSPRPLDSLLIGVDIVFDAAAANTAGTPVPPMITDSACDFCHATALRPAAGAANVPDGSLAKRVNETVRTSIAPCNLCHPAATPNGGGVNP